MIYEYVCVHWCPSVWRRPLTWRRRVVQEKASGIIFAPGTWGSRALRRRRCGVSDRRAGLLGLGWFSSHPCRCEGMYLWEFNATPASVSLSENSFAVFTTKLYWGSVRVSFSSTLQQVKGNDACLIPISSFSGGFGGWELTAIYIPHLRQFRCLLKPPLYPFRAGGPIKTYQHIIRGLMSNWKCSGIKTT